MYNACAGKEEMGGGGGGAGRGGYYHFLKIYKLDNNILTKIQNKNI